MSAEAADLEVPHRALLCARQQGGRPAGLPACSYLSLSHPRLQRLDFGKRHRNPIDDLRPLYHPPPLPHLHLPL